MAQYDEETGLRMEEEMPQLKAVHLTEYERDLLKDLLYYQLQNWTPTLSKVVINQILGKLEQ